MYFVEKLWKNRLRNAFIMILLIFPSLEILMFVKQFLSMGVYYPEECFFLRSNSIMNHHMLQNVFIWPFPLYMISLFSIMHWKERKSGYETAVISRMGKKRYLRENLLLSFGAGFSIIFLSMLLNQIFTFLAFNGGKLTRIENDKLIYDGFLKWQIAHPILDNILFSLIISFVAGIVAMAATMCALRLKDIKIVFGLILAIWFALFEKKNSIALLFQPMSEYSVGTIVPLFLEVTVVYFGVIFLVYVMGKRDEI